MQSRVLWTVAVLMKGMWVRPVLFVRSLGHSPLHTHQLLLEVTGMVLNPAQFWRRKGAFE